LAFTVFSSGCAFYVPQGYTEFSYAEVDLESKNFVVRKLGAQGAADRSYVFGVPAFGAPGAVIGIPTDFENHDIQARAWDDLSRNWDGKGSVVYHNVNQEWAAYGFPGIFIWHQHTITADIYEFIDEYVDYATRGERGM
jgi:hypothetical protein